jgi:hypothetical protein
MKRKMIWLAILVFILLVVSIFYIALRNTRSDVSSKEPYVRYLGEVMLVKPAYVVKNEFPIVEENLLVDDPNGYGKALALTVGTKVKLTSAIHYRNGVSGVTHSLMLGSVQTENGLMQFEYYWGRFHALCLEPPCNYWTYPQAFWQSDIDTVKYY